MGEHSKLRTICEEGKGKLQWERDIPPKDLENLENLANTDFHANLGKIIHDIYLTGHNLFRYVFFSTVEKLEQDIYFSFCVKTTIFFTLTF